MTALLIVVLLISLILLLAKGGLWDNLLIWIGCLLSGLLATNYFEPMANWLEKSVGRDFHWFWDFLAFWGIYCLSMTLWRLATDAIAPTRLRFRVPVEWAGKSIFGLLTGWTLCCLTAFSAHLAPTEMFAWNESFMEKPTDMAFLGADYLWMSFAHKVSHPESSLFGSDSAHQFDPEGVFRVKYGLRRWRYQHLESSKGPSPQP